MHVWFSLNKTIICNWNKYKTGRLRFMSGENVDACFHIDYHTAHLQICVFIFPMSNVHACFTCKMSRDTWLTKSILHIHCFWENFSHASFEIVSLVKLLVLIRLKKMISIM